MHVRKMTEADLPVIVELEKQLFEDPWSRTSFEFELKKNRFSIPVVLEENHLISGYAIIWKIYEEFHIANFAIRSDFQNKGLGSFFLREILQLGSDSQFGLLEVRESNSAAIHLYEKFGFKTIMKRAQYYHNGETALVMQKIFRKSTAPIHNHEHG